MGARSTSIAAPTATVHATSIDSHQVIDFRLFCAALAGFHDAPFSERVALAFELYDVDDMIECRMDQQALEAAIMAVVVTVRVLWEEAMVVSKISGTGSDHHPDDEQSRFDDWLAGIRTQFTLNTV
eukprot:jgi/Hompol1/1853/HPOL_005748-RA